MEVPERKREMRGKKRNGQLKFGKELRRWERMREDVEFCLLENVRSYLRIYSFLKKLFLGSKSSQNAEDSEYFLGSVSGKVFLGNFWDVFGEFLGGYYAKEKLQRSMRKTISGEVHDDLQNLRSHTICLRYANDYDIINRIKKFTDKHGVCVLLVHHTRKQNADDKFDMISGTTALLGAADGGFILQKEKRTSNSATLEVSGRDQPDQKLKLIRNTETLLWELEEVETELWKEPPEPLLERVAEFITADNREWSGTPTELVEALKMDMKANALSMKLNVNAGRLFNEYSIIYENKRSHDGRKIRLYLAKRDDA